MLIGHLAVGFASKKFAPRTSLVLLFAAAELSDIVFSIFALLGREHARFDPGHTRYMPLDLYDYPWSHSLLMDCVWAAVFAGVYYASSRYRPGALAIGIGVVSHWILDWICHGPDMPLSPGSAKYGLGLWNSVWGTMTVEIAMFVIGVGLYFTATRARDRLGRWVFVAFVALNLGLYIAQHFSPPPTNRSEVLAWPGMVVLALLLSWAWWFDRHRNVSPAQPA